MKYIISIMLSIVFVPLFFVTAYADENYYSENSKKHAPKRSKNVLR